MGEDESGDLKTPLKHKIFFIKLYTKCLKDFNPWKDFSNERKITLLNIRTCIKKRRVLLLLLLTFLNTFQKKGRGSLKERERAKRKEGWNKGRWGNEGKKTKGGSKQKKRKKGAANYEAKGRQKFKKTGQRKRKQMAVIKNKKKGSEQSKEGCPQGGKRGL